MLGRRPSFDEVVDRLAEGFRSAHGATLEPGGLSPAETAEMEALVAGKYARTGSKTGSVTIPTVGETSANVWYRFHLTVRDSAGATHSSFVDVRPRTVTLTLATSPTGLQLLLDGQPVTAPVSVTGVVGILRSLEAVSPQSPGGVHRTFASWSDGGARAHAVSTPGVSTTYTATFAAIPAVNVDDREVASGAASNAARSSGVRIHRRSARNSARTSSDSGAAAAS